MRNRKILKLFITFLKQKGLYYEYLNCLSNGAKFRKYIRNDFEDPTIFLTHTVKCEPFNLITCAFNWNEGMKITRNKWSNLNYDWVDVLTKNKRIVNYGR